MTLSTTHYIFGTCVHDSFNFLIFAVLILFFNICRTTLTESFWKRKDSGNVGVVQMVSNLCYKWFS